MDSQNPPRQQALPGRFIFSLSECMTALFQQKPGLRAVRLAACWLILLWSLITLAASVWRMDGWRDHGLFYYAPRLLLRGQDVYDWERMKQEWRNDGMPSGVDPGATMSGFVMPPEMGLLTLPPALAPPRFAYRAIDVWNLTALGLCLFFLLLAATRTWPVEVRLLFAAFVVTLPDVAGTVRLGQSTLVICACLSGALYAFLKRRTGAGGVGIGLALAKFTLALPFLGILVYRRKWKAVFFAALVFTGANLLFSLPFGTGKTIAEYRRVLTRENLPGASYDPISSNPAYMPNSMVDGERLLYLVLGNHRKMIEVCYALLSMCAIAAMAFVLERHGEFERVFERPLEIALLILAGLLLFYHRSYDLSAMLIVCYAVIEDAVRDPANRTPLWSILVVLLAVLCHTSPLAFRLLKPSFTDAAIAHVLCWTNCTMLLALFLLCACRIYFQRKRGPAALPR